MHALAPEAEYICDLARAWSRDVVGTVPPLGRLDQDRFVRLLSSQPAMQALVRYVDRSILPESESEMLDRAVEVSRRRTTMMLLELERVLPALEAVGCRPVVLKGASLALTVYDEPEDRWFVDLDLLVEPRHLDEVYAALGQLGYHFSEALQARKYYEKYHFHRIMMSTQGVCIEVHWAVTMPQSVYDFDVDAMRGAARPVPLGGSTVLAPHAVDQILHGVLQSIPASFGDLRRILDLHRLDAVITDPERRAMGQRAHQYNLATGLWLQYRVRETLLGHDIPAVIEEQCRPSAALVRTLDSLDLSSRCLQPKATRIDDFGQLVHLLCIPSGRRAREIGRYLVPSEEVRLQSELQTGEPVRSLDVPMIAMRRLVSTGRMMAHLARAMVTSPAR